MVQPYAQLAQLEQLAKDPNLGIVRAWRRAQRRERRAGRRARFHGARCRDVRELKRTFDSAPPARQLAAASQQEAELAAGVRKAPEIHQLKQQINAPDS